MINYWWITRPKRDLIHIPDVLSAFLTVSLNQEWSGQRETQLEFESLLETLGLKRPGTRRDQQAGGARTYWSWLKSLGLVFQESQTGKVFPTFAGQDIIDGVNPVKVLTDQVLKFQYPSPYSLSPNVKINERFRVHPFWFLLRLLRDSSIRYLTQEEIAKVVAVKAENDSERCHRAVVSDILRFRSFGDDSLEPDYAQRYSSNRTSSTTTLFDKLDDMANTIINWLSYTRLITRDHQEIRIAPDKIAEVDAILSDAPRFIDRPENHEVFQRKYGLSYLHERDNRRLLDTVTVTRRSISENRIKTFFIRECMTSPIRRITPNIIQRISNQTGESEALVEDVLNAYYSSSSTGMLEGFLAGYREMAFAHREQCTEFEIATKEVMQNIFGYRAKHVGAIGLTPDVIVFSDSDGYSGIFDNKAYASYSIVNDHRTRMLHNYIPGISNYDDGEAKPLAFFSYIAGGFGPNIDNQILSISDESGVPGSAINIIRLIELIQRHEDMPYSHQSLRNIFGCGRQISSTDF